MYLGDVNFSDCSLIFVGAFHAKSRWLSVLLLGNMRFGYLFIVYFGFMLVVSDREQLF